MAVLKYNCDSCFRDISAVVHIQCAECEEVDLCVECFGNGTVLSTASQHLPTHAYRVIPPLGEIRGLAEEWRADEELVLIEALEANGVGNWQEVAEQLPGRDGNACFLHYARVHLPPAVHDQCLRVVQHPVPANNGMPSLPATHEIAGFMPGRGEYEQEWENDFELTYLKDFQLLPTTTTNESEEHDKELKMAVLRHYCSVIEERQARRSFAHNNHYTKDFKKILQGERARSRTEQRVLHHLRPFARFLSPVDFDVMVAGCVEEEELRRRIQQLQEYRRAGLRSFSQVQCFEQDQKHLDLYLKGGGSIMSILEPPQLPTATPVGPVGSTPTPTTGGFAQPQARKASAPLNITNMEGYELLSEKERHICSILRLYPRLYLSIKDTLIREYLKHGFLRRAQARAAVKIDVNKTSKLYDFFVSAGWVRPATDGD